MRKCWKRKKWSLEWIVCDGEEKCRKKSPKKKCYEFLRYLNFRIILIKKKNIIVLNRKAILKESVLRILIGFRIPFYCQKI